ncbi:MAG: serpin family protein [Deltaproteobacteria bacterium]|nr:serpin family protein [Deltaproteobacteria bacterium]
MLAKRIGWWMLASGCALAACVASSDKDEAAPGSGQTIQEARSDKPRDTSPNISDAAFAELITGNNAFAFDLFHKLATPGANHVSSPLSVSVALGMTWAGARTTTESQMATALHFTLPQSSLHTAMNKLLLELASRNTAPKDAASDKVLRLDLVNAAWAQRGYEFVPAYLDTIAVEYGAGINLLNFTADPKGATDAINGWVASKTQDKIQELIPYDSITGATRLVLTNTLYFFGNWSAPFEKSATADATFHAVSSDVTASMMNRTIQTRYAEGDGWQMAELPYQGNQVAMAIVLPAEGRFDEIQGLLSASWLLAADAGATSTSVDLSIPKFRFTWGTQSLVQPLQALGMVDAFLPSADFFAMKELSSPIKDEWLNIGDILHKAFISVDEEGTEAAAATAVIMDACLDAGVPPQGKELIANRPFLFLIRDRTTKSLLFVGQVVDPTKG